MDWNRDAGKSADTNGFGIKLTDGVAKDMRYLRLKRMDTSDFVMVTVSRENLNKSQPIEGSLWWSGGTAARGPKGNQNRLIGIARLDWAARSKGQHLVRREPGRLHLGYRGWGFSKEAGTEEQEQTWCWAGDPIGKTVFEIAVKSSDLSDNERSKLLTSDAKPPPEAVTTVTEDVDAGPATRMARPQSTIKALYIADTSTGQLGLASDLILTATPGTPKSVKDGIAPVTFTTKAGNQMHMVLDDVLRAIKVKYPRVTGVAKIELSFEDKYTPKDGGSIGAAIGTLMLSVIEGFEVDPKLAITGDVTADSKVRKIGGVAAKIRGATAAGCRIVALPVENYDQVADTFVWDGAGPLTNVQVIGIGNLSDAAALARTTRDDQMTQALTLFEEVQQTLKKSAGAVRSKPTRDKLAKVIELCPTHYSAKLLLAVAEDKQPRRLSTGASLYYAMTAMNAVFPSLAERTEALNKGQLAQVTSTSIQEGLKTLDKVRRIGAPDVIPLVDAVSQFVRELRDVQAGSGSLQTLETRRQKLMDALTKLSTDRAMMERTLREGV